MTETSLPSWVATNRHVVAWDDGFRPSGASATDAAPAPGKMVVDQPRTSPGLFRVVESAVPDALAGALYDSAVAAKVWGVYIRTSDIFDRQLEAYPHTKDDHARHTLALRTIRAFLLDAEAIPAADWAATHGVVVWVITSTVSDTVAYHMDYAEMFRYQTNVTYPPMYGATLHVSRLNETPESHMEGGAFYANTRGLDHYKEHGYKESVASLPSLEQMTTDASYEVVPYKYKRGIVMDGNFPHGSIPVSALPSETARVVVGFNLFNYEIGPHAEAYPEHSAKFNKYVKVAQAAAAKTATLSLASIKRCPRQAAFLRFLLRKAKEKNLIQNETFVGHTSTSSAAPTT